MSLKQELHLAYVLHTRSFRETSLLVEFLSAAHGRVSAVARGAKRGKAKASSLLQPFMPVNISWYGNGELVTLTAVEISKTVTALQGRSAICGLYVNELLLKLLHKLDPCPDLFAVYESTIANLALANQPAQVVLRKFELQLLRSLGYGLQLNKDVDTGATIVADNYYLFDPLLGPKLVHSAHGLAIKGVSLLALAAGVFDDPLVLLDLKRLMRQVLRHHLGAKQLMSRELL